MVDLREFATTDSVLAAYRPEATPGTLDVAGPFERFLTLGIDVSTSDEMEEDDSIDGSFETVGEETISQEADLSVPAKWRWNDTRVLVEQALKNTLPAEVSVSVTVDIDLAATRQDGSTGPQIYPSTPDPAAFDALIGYDGATANGAEFLMMEMEGAANSENNRSRRCWHVWKDGSNAYIDVYLGHVNGPVGSVYEPMVAESNAAVTISVGSAARNRPDGSSYYLSWLWELQNVQGSRAAEGCRCNKISWSGDGSGSVEVATDWMAANLLPRQQSHDYTSGQGFAANYLRPPFLKSSKDMLFAAALPVDNTPILLSSRIQTQWEISVELNAQVANGVQGTFGRAGFGDGKAKVTGSINTYDDGPIAASLHALSDESSRQKAHYEVGYRNQGFGNLYLAVTNAEWGFSASSPGSAGSFVEPEFSFSGAPLSNTSRTVIYQEIS